MHVVDRERAQQSHDHMAVYTVPCSLYRFQRVNVDVFHRCRSISLFAVWWSPMRTKAGDLIVGFVIVEDRVGVVCLKGVSARVHWQVIKLRWVVVAATECKKSCHDVTASLQLSINPCAAIKHLLMLFCHFLAKTSKVNPFKSKEPQKHCHTEVYKLELLATELVCPWNIEKRVTVK